MIYIVTRGGKEVCFRVEGLGGLSDLPVPGGLAYLSVALPLPH